MKNVTHEKHVSNQVSLEIVSDSFDDAGNHAKVNQPPPSQAMQPCSSRDASDLVDITADQIERPASNNNMLAYIKTSITLLISKSYRH